MEIREQIDQIISEQVSELMQKLGCTGGCIRQEIDASEMIFITTNQIINLIKEAGYVKLASDQTVSPAMYLAIRDAQWDYIKEGWRRVE